MYKDNTLDYRNTNYFTIFVHKNFRRKGHSKLWVSYTCSPSAMYSKCGVTKLICFWPNNFYLYEKFNLVSELGNFYCIHKFHKGEGGEPYKAFFSANIYSFTLFIWIGVSFKNIYLIFMIILTGTAYRQLGGRSLVTWNSLRKPNNFHFYTIFRSFLKVIFKKIPCHQCF